MRLLRILAIGLLIPFFCGCSGSSNLAKPNFLIGKKWILSSLMGKPDLSEFNLGMPTLSFLEGDRLAGFAGCNSFSGNFTLEGSRLILDRGAMTKKNCLGIGEDEFITSLEKVNNFTVEKEKLTLMEGSLELMSFIPKKE
jgi:heat shock protein HslJ